MSESKINGVNQNYEALDFKELSDDLSLAEVENLSEKDFALSKFQSTGQRPGKIAVADAEKFGLKKAFWDVYAPVEQSTSGRWVLEKDADTGEEFISLKES